MKFRYYWLFSIVSTGVGFGIVYGLFTLAGWIHDHVWENLSQVVQARIVAALLYLAFTLVIAVAVWTINEGAQDRAENEKDGVPLK